MKLIQDLGMQFATEDSKNRSRFGIYECTECFSHFRARTNNVKSRKQKLCNGCKNITHKGTGTRLYNILHKMRQRCNNDNDTSYPYYGGRGISICSEWGEYENFRDWATLNGYSDKLTIDRIDNNGNYEPNNCRWVAQSVQARNTKRLRSNNTSGYRGIFFNRQRNKWVAQIKVDRKSIHLGQFQEKLDAAKAYDNYVLDNKLEHTINGVQGGLNGV